MERVGDDRSAGRREGARDESFGIAGKNRCDSNRGLDTGIPQRLHYAPSFFDRGAVRFEDTPDVVAVGGNREADADGRARCCMLQQTEIAQDQRAAGLNHENRGG